MRSSNAHQLVVSNDQPPIPAPIELNDEADEPEIGPAMGGSVAPEPLNFDNLQEIAARDSEPGPQEEEKKETPTPLTGWQMPDDMIAGLGSNNENGAAAATSDV